MTTYPFLQHFNTTGKIWQAGSDVYGLCAAWNHATNPALPMSDWEHSRARQYARAIRNRMTRLGIVEGRDFRELSNGSLWPMSVRKYA